MSGKIATDVSYRYFSGMVDKGYIVDYGKESVRCFYFFRILRTSGTPWRRTTLAVERFESRNCEKTGMTMTHWT